MWDRRWSWRKWASRVQKNNTRLFCRTEGPEREADDWSQQSSEELYNLNTLNGTNSDPGFSPKPVRITLPVNVYFWCYIIQFPGQQSLFYPKVISWYRPLTITKRLKGLSHEIDFKNVDENGQILALTRAAAGFWIFRRLLWFLIEIKHQFPGKC